MPSVFMREYFEQEEADEDISPQEKADLIRKARAIAAEKAKAAKEAEATAEQSTDG